MFPRGLGCFRMGVPLSPGMASRKLQVLGFYKLYYARWGKAPSVGECAGDIGISSTRVKQLLRQLEADRMIIRQPGVRRGITFPEPADRISEGDALMRLRELGYVLDVAFPCPNSTLPKIPRLTHIPDVEIGGLPDEGTAQPG